MKFLNHLRLESQLIDPSKLSIFIHETYIIFISSNRFGFGTPLIGKYEFERMTRHTGRFRIRELMALCLLTRATHIIFIRLLLDKKIKISKNY
jgi:hypothetical protein